MGPNVSDQAFAGVYQFDQLTLNDNVEVTSSGISQLIIKVNGTLRMGKNAAIRVRNGYSYYSGDPVVFTNLNQNNLDTYSTNASGNRFFPWLYGRGGDGGQGGYGGSESIYKGGFYCGGGGGGGGGFGGGHGGAGGDSRGSAYGEAGQPNGGAGGRGGTAYVYYNGSYPYEAVGNAAGGLGGAAATLGTSGAMGLHDTETYGVATGSGGGGGNSGPGSAGVYARGNGSGSGGGGGGYGGGVLIIMADAITYDSAFPPHFLVSGQVGGVSTNSSHTGAAGQNGEGGLLIIQARQYAPDDRHWNLGTNPFGGHTVPSLNGGHGVVTGNPSKVLIFSSGCSYSLSATGTNFSSGARSGSFTVSATSGCVWTAATTAAWLRTTSSGSGNGTVAYTVDANGGSAFRTGTITVGGQTFTVTQGPAGFVWHNVFGWVFEAGGGWFHHNGFGWMWISPNQWIWSLGLQGWVATMDSTSRTLWSPQFRWLTPSENDPYQADTTAIGAIYLGQYNGSAITEGWVVSDRFGYVWAAGDGKWFYSNTYGWLGVTDAGGIWCVNQGKFL